MILFFDIESNGLPKDYQAPYTDVDNWPRMAQIAIQVYQDDGVLFYESKKFVKPNGWTIPKDQFFIDNNMSTERCEKEGIDIRQILGTMMGASIQCHTIVAHNIDFDFPILQAEFLRAGLPPITSIDQFCTMKATTDLLQLTGRFGFKWPKLEELCAYLGVNLEGAHDALNDVRATAACYFELKKRGLLPQKQNGNITYSNFQRHDNLPADQYFKLGGFSHSRVKRDNNGSPTFFEPTKKMLIGTMVDKILTEPENVDVTSEHYTVARKIAVVIHQTFGDLIKRFKPQVCFTADMLYNNLTMKTTGRLDWLLERHAVIDLKFTTSKTLEPIVDHFGYRNQIWNYAKPFGLKKGYILAYSELLGECLPVFPVDCTSDYNEFWAKAVLKHGEVK